MVCLLGLSLCLLSLSLHSPLTTSSPYPNSSAQLCHEDEKVAMLKFKNNLTIGHSSSVSRVCSFYGQVPYAKTASWKATGSDCCQWDGVMCSPLTGHVVRLDLSCSKLRGTIPMNSTLFTLRHLRSLNLAFNDFFPSRISPEFGRFPRLKLLNLSTSNFTGKVPLTIGQLPQLASLDLAQLPDINPYLEMPDFDVIIGNLTGLRELYLDYVHVKSDSSTLSSLTNLSSLRALTLIGCNISGPLPDWIWNITREIRLSGNQFIGELPSMVDVSKLSHLTLLDVSENLLDGAIPSWLFSLPSLTELDLDDNKFSGQLTNSHDVTSNHTTLLEYIDLSGNNIQGSIPNSIFELASLVSLVLSSNNLSGVVEYDMLCKLKNLKHLVLSNNGLSLPTKSSNVATCPKLISLLCSSCNIIEFPDFLRYQEDLYILDLSNNKIHGHIPKWIREFNKNLFYIDLHSNMFEGPAPIPPRSAMIFLASNNSFTGELPSLICTLASLWIIDLSYNSLSGEIPRCFENFTNQLSVLDLRSNKFHGTLPSSFGKCSGLSTLDLNGNQLEGKLPPSLLRCQRLEVLDIGNNNFKGLFPCWLGALPKLRVLILRSNNFHGNIGTCKAKHPFSTLQILDLSNNGFNGTLPSSLLHSFKAMMNSNEERGKLKYLDNIFYNDSIMLVVKGQDRKYVKLLDVIITIDVSNNKLKGELPEMIGDLVSLRWLNLSHNNLIGRIPPSLASLSELESLDLSSNKLVGQIPEELSSLSFLTIFNVSQNRLVGPIPQGQQFATFQNNSYLGNLGLCGNPLSKKCGEDEAPSDAPPRMDQDGNNFEYKGAFSWVMVGIGYGCGTVIGLVAGYYIVIARNPVWLLRLARRLKNASNQLF